MNTIIQKIILPVYLMLNFSMICNSQNNPSFEVEPNYIDLNSIYQSIYPGNYVEFTFVAKKQFFQSLETYSVTYNQYVYASTWISLINPNYFQLDTPSDEVEVKVSGTIPIEFTPGNYAFVLDVKNVNDPNIWQEVWVEFEVLPSIGIEDRIEITSSVNSFSVGDLISYEADFFDEDPFGDEIDEWNLTITLFHSQGDYTYVDLTNLWGSGSTYWNISAPSLPPNLIYTRNELGQALGLVTVTGLDTDGIYHQDVMEIGINLEPAKPVVYPQQIDDGSVKLVYQGQGATSYLIYYDTDPNPPYNGTGLTQGNSPINAGSQTQITLDGLTNCTTYYFTVKGENSDGISGYSDEVSINTFEAPNSLPINVHLYDLEISEDTQLDGNYYFVGDLIIESGATAEWIGGTLFFEEGSKIIIESEAKLILDGATCTAPCGQTWGGIEVWGDEDEAQLPDGNGKYSQGFLELKNWAVVENTTQGIELWRPGYYETTGGIIDAEDAVFRNNAKSVYALYYSNIDPQYPTVELDYYGRFVDCIFEITSDYHGEATFHKHIDLSNVKGLRFEGCDFIVDADAQNVSAYNAGIAAYNAGFTAEAYCTTQNTPCSDYDESTFDGFNYAIYATGGASTYTFAINRAIFTNNKCGVQVQTVNNYSVLFSEFNIGYNAVDEGECEGEGMTAAGFGINSSNSSGFAIEENDFTKNQGAAPGNYVGIRMENTEAADQIYLNTFEGLSYANYTEGQNFRTGYTWEGLEFNCNHNSNNYADFFVKEDLINSSGIQCSQGSPNYAAGNDFSQSGTTWHFYNGGDFMVGYYYYDNIYYSNQNPDDLKCHQVIDQGITNVNYCRSHYGGGSGETEGRGLVLNPDEILETEQLYASGLTDYSNVKSLFNQLKDGGNTEALKSEVETAWPTDMWQLREELLGKSPHLSQEVLMAAADKTEVLPDAVLFEILAANPDELKKEELLKYLEDKENPLPAYMIEILRQVAEGTTYKTILEQQMSQYNQAKTLAAYEMIRSNLNDGAIDLQELRNWLDNVGGRRANEQIIASFLQEGNFADALALAELLPQLYDYDTREMEEHNMYLDILNLEIQLRQDERSIKDLDSTELQNLISIAETSVNTAGSIARGILETQYGHHFCDCLNTIENEGFKNSGPASQGALNTMFGGSIDVNPNPANDWTSFKYTLPSNESEAVIKISNVMGEIIDVFTVSGQQGQKIWDTRKIKPGVYFYTFVVNDLKKSGKIIVK
nr:T9SS type A sorting domain-containing protein [Bacteroidota bacterium]